MAPSPIFVAAIDKLARDVMTDLELKEQPAHPATPEHWASCPMLWCRDIARQERERDSR